LELFSGTESFSKVMREKGFQCVTLDNNPIFDSTICIDILDIKIETLPKNPIVIWASPPCESFSVTQIGRNWHKDHTPKTEKALQGLQILGRTIKIIAAIQPTYWIIENPRGKMRKIINPIFERYNITDFKRETVTYCQYGDYRMKPTDIWTNIHSWIPRAMCKNGDPCHERAPRGSNKGTQGLRNSIERSIVPRSLCEEIRNSIIPIKTPIQNSLSTFLEVSD